VPNNIDKYFVSINTKGNLQKPSQRHFSGLSTTSLAGEYVKGKEREKRWKQKEFSPRGTIIFSSQIKKKCETETQFLLQGISK
jgi:hypothetical protein